MTTDLAALLAEHSMYSYVPKAKGYVCDCGVMIFRTPEDADADESLMGRHAAHQAGVIAAAGWRKSREEWGLQFERDADPTMDNPSGEVTNTYVSRDEANARRAVRMKVPISARNRRVVRRYVTDWEEDK